jgi:superfamily II DNA or RNA helicase
MTGPSAVRSFGGTWRPYQQLALAAFEADRAAGRHQSFIVCPPGAGKTLLGWEAIARIGAPALVLVPGRTVLEQWRQTASLFDATAHLTQTLVEDARHVTCLTYQALCVTDTQDVLGALAHQQVAAELAALGSPTGRILTDGDHATRLRSARRSLTARAARGEIADLEVAQLLSPAAVARLTALREAGIGCVVLDECHHLSGLWGRVVHHALQELGRPHVVALTATPDWYPTRAQAQLLKAIHGPVDFQIPTPAVVRDGYLAPYVTLTAFCEPTLDEQATLRLQDDALARLVEDVLLFSALAAGGATSGADLSFIAWLTTRLARRLTGPDGADEVLSWPRAFARWPAQLTAAARIVRSQGLPADAPDEEALCEAPTSDDWRTAIGDWVVGSLRRAGTPEAEAMVDAVTAHLKPLGWGLGRWGVRRTQSPTDQVVMHSRAKLGWTGQILAAEAEVRTRLVAAVVCEVAGGDGTVLGVREVVRDLAEGAAGALRCVGVSAQGEWSPAGGSAGVLAALGPGWTAVPSASCGPLVVDLVPPSSLVAGTGGWMLALTQALQDGGLDVLVGTRGLLGEGWNCPALTTLVDLTTATTSVAVEQLRGRPLRLDPADPEKVATVWDVVCVAPELADGHRDYERFARRHEHLHAPCADGVIERGVSHVDAALSPTAAPDAETGATVTADSFARLRALAGQRELWRIGTPYRGVELPAVLVRDAGTALVPAREAGPAASAPPVPAHREVGPAAARRAWAAAVDRARRGAGAAGGGGVLLAGAAAALAPAWAAVGPLGAAAGAGVWLVRRGAAQDGPAHPRARGLDAVVGCLLDAAVTSGTVDAAAAHAELDTREDGSVRVLFPLATPEVADVLTRSLQQALADPLGQDWWVSRPWPHASRGAAARELLGIGAERPRCWQAVPEHFARAAPRRAAYLEAHRRWFGTGELADMRDGADGAGVGGGAGVGEDDAVERGGRTVRRRTVWR